MEHLSPLDAMFLDAEDADASTSMAIASVAVIEGPAPTTRSSSGPSPHASRWYPGTGSGPCGCRST